MDDVWLTEPYAYDPDTDTWLGVSSVPFQPTGWEITMGNGVALVKKNNYNKTHYIELDSDGNSGLAQSVDVHEGEPYVLTFDFGARGEMWQNVMEVYWEGNLLDTVHI